MSEETRNEAAENGQEMEGRQEEQAQKQEFAESASQGGQAGPGEGSVRDRCIATLLDALALGCVIGVLSIIFRFVPMLGPVLIALAGMALWGARDILVDKGVSIGKKVMGLRVVRTDGSEITIEDSVKRNIPFMIGCAGNVFTIIPVLGILLNMLVGLAGLCVICYELYLLAGKKKQRYFDELAGTRVIKD